MITSYCDGLKLFLVFHREKPIGDITNDAPELIFNGEEFYAAKN